MIKIINWNSKYIEVRMIMLEIFAQNIIHMIQENFLIGPFFALVAGIFTSLTPCAMSNIPLVTGYVTADADEESQKPLFLSLVFAAGSAVTFIALGLIAASLGKVVGHSEILHIILGVLMILMAFQMWGLIHLIPHVHGLSGEGKQGFAGAFFTGMIGGIFSSHCATPVILMLLTITAEKGNFLWGMILLFCYSVGHGIIIVAAGTSVGFANKLENGAADTTTKVFKVILGLIMLGIGVYMLFGD